MTIRVIPTIDPYLLPKVLPKVRKQYLNFKLKIIEEQSYILVEKVRTGEIDAAILALPYVMEGLMNFDFWQKNFYWICHKDECLQKAHEISSEELEIDKLMLPKEGHCLKEHALAACSLQNRKQDADFDSASLHTLVQMVAGKFGITIVRHMALDQLTYSESELKAIHLNEPAPHSTIALIIRPNYVRSEALSILQNIFTQQLTHKCSLAR